jgi:hypothetical protein
VWQRHLNREAGFEGEGRVTACCNMSYNLSLLRTCMRRYPVYMVLTLVMVIQCLDLLLCSFACEIVLICVVIVLFILTITRSN